MAPRMVEIAVKKTGIVLNFFADVPAVVIVSDESKLMSCCMRIKVINFQVLLGKPCDPTLHTSRG